MISRWQFVRTVVSLAAVLVYPAYAPGQTPIRSDTAAPAESRLPQDESVPVRLHNTRLFDVHEPIGNLGTHARADAIERRILRLASGPSDVLDRLRVEEHSNAADLYAGDVLVCTVTDADALPLGRTHEQLAADYAVRVRTVLAGEFQERSLSSLLRASLVAVGATVVLVALLVSVRRLYVRLRSKLAESAFRSSMWIWLAKRRLLSPEIVRRMSRSLASTAALVVSVVATYVYLQFALGLFPWTRGAADTMSEGASSAVLTVIYGVGAYLPKLLSILVIVFLVHFAIRGCAALFRQIGAGRLTIQGFYPEWAQPTFTIIRFLLVAIGTVMVFPYLPGSGSEGFRGVSVFIGVLVSLGGASAIANIISGLVITYMRPFRAGDRVKIADAVGDVMEKDLFVVRLRTIKNVDITIPNSLVLANHIVNFSSSAQGEGLILHVTVTIGYSTPWRKMQELLIAAARRTEGIIADPPPFVLQTKLDDFYVHYEINAYTKSPSQMANIYSRLNASIQDACNEAGVEIMSPHFAAVRDGNRVGIPDDYLPKNYRAPSFNIFAARGRQPEL
jgi:small-conductance mechanosensitive channel